MGFQFTKPEALQVSFESIKTGTHPTLKAYLEAAEKGNKTIGQLLAELFNEDGSLKQLATPSTLNAAVVAATTQAQNAEASADEAALAASSAASAAAGAVAAQVSAATTQAGLAAASRSAAEAAYNNTLAAVANFPGRNKIINGKMEIAQRGTSFPLHTNGNYTLDGWGVSGSSAVITVSQQFDGPPAAPEFLQSLRVAVTTAATVTGAQNAGVAHPIEGYNIQDLIGRTFTVSFWVRSSKVGSHSVAIWSPGLGNSYFREYFVSAANTWERKVLTFTGGLLSAAPWGQFQNAGMTLSFILAAGSNYHAAEATWHPAYRLSTASQVNCLDTVGNIFAITGVQLELGAAATPFEHRPYQLELAICQRYYERSASNTENIYSGSVTSGSTYYAPISFAVPKRANPVNVVLTDGGNVGFPAVAPTVGASSPTGFYASKTSNGTTPGGYYQFGWTAASPM